MDLLASVTTRTTAARMMWPLLSIVAAKKCFISMGYPILRDAIVAVAGPAAVCAANELGVKHCDENGPN